MTPSDFNVILPTLLLSGYACVLLLVDLFIPDDRKRWTAWLGMLGLVAGAVGHVAWRSDISVSAFNGMLTADGYALFLDFIFLVTGALTILLAINYLPRTGLDRGEFYPLLLFTISGMMLMGQASNL